MKYFAGLFTSADAKRLVTHGKPVSAAAIARAERALGVEFSPSLVAYLRELGWLTIASTELFGLGRTVPRGMNLVETTEWERSCGCPLKPHLIPLSNDGFGNLYCVDLRTDRIVFWFHEAGPKQRPGSVAPTLRAWIAQELKDAIAAEPENAKLDKLLARWKRVGTAKLSKPDRAALEAFFGGDIPA